MISTLHEIRSLRTFNACFSFLFRRKEPELPATAHTLMKSRAYRLASEDIIIVLYQRDPPKCHIVNFVLACTNASIISLQNSPNASPFKFMPHKPRLPRVGGGGGGGPSVGRQPLVEGVLWKAGLVGVARLVRWRGKLG